MKLTTSVVAVAASRCSRVRRSHAQNPDIDAHVAAAKAAVGSDHQVLFTSLCSAEPTGPGTRAGGAGRVSGARRRAPPGPPARERWHAEPVKVFDNLYFVGMTEFSAWAVTTSEGIIIIDALFDYSVDDEVAEGLKKVGLDPAKIKYVIISHGHSDHSGGAKFLQDSYKARVLLSAADWDLLDRGRGTRPARDMVATDGQKLTLGDTTITMYITPGHTAGTLSYLIPVKDHGTPHLVAEWGGTAFNFPRTPENFRDLHRVGDPLRRDRDEGRRRRPDLEPLGVRRLEDQAARAAGPQARRSESVRRRHRLGEALHEDRRGVLEGLGVADCEVKLRSNEV